MGTMKTISDAIVQNRTWEYDEFFNVDQKRRRDEAKKHYETFI